jgi:serine phosphatase RsbU (regulator of sigma subunit)
MRNWLRKFTMPQAEDEETAHREFVLNSLLLGGIGLLGTYVLIDWAIIIPIRGSLGFGNYLWPPMLLVLLFNYWLVRRRHSYLVSYLILATVTLVTWLSLYGLGSKDISVLLLAFGVALAGILIGSHGAIVVLALDTLAFAALVWAENSGLRPPPVAVSNLVDVIALGLILGALVMVEWLFRFERGRLLSRYREQTSALRAANEALEQANRQAAQQEAWRRELALAKEIQLSLLPQYTPTLADFDIKGRSTPAEEVGGDFYTYLPLSGGRLGLAIGDVSGKGMASALYMAIATSVVEAQATTSADSASLVRDVNNLLYRRVQGTGMNTALLYALFDLTRRQVRVANAGLITPILYHDGAFSYVDCYGLPLGVVPGEVYEEQRIDLCPGDVILLMTDGIVEAMNRSRDLYGFPRLEAVLAKCDMSNAQHVVDAVFDSIFEFMEGVPPHDDMTLVAVRLADRRAPRQAPSG